MYPLSMHLILLISSASRWMLVALKFSAILFGFEDFETTAMPWCSKNEMHTYIYILKNQQVNNNNNVNHYHYSVCEYAQPAGVNIKQPFLSVIDSTRCTQQESVEPPNKGHFESVGFCPLLEGCPATT